MTQFTYKARTMDGEAREGVMDVVNKDLAVDILKKSNLIIVSLEEVGGEKKKWWEVILGQGTGKVKVKDVAIFSRQIATLFEAKVPVVRALKTLIAEAQSRILQDVLSDILDDVSGGSSLSLALSKHPNAFSYFYVNMVKAGEESGKLQEIFIYLADYEERTSDLTSKIRNALIYPAFITATFVAVVVLMMVVVVPKMVDIFRESNAPIPFYTQVVFATALFLKKFGILLALILLGGIVGLFQYFKTPSGKEVLDTASLKVPLFGVLLQKFYLSRFSDTLSSLINSGVPIIRALQVTASVIDNKVYEAVVLDAAKAVKSGNSIGFALEQYPEIPPLLTQMVRIGEESGKLDFILQSLAGFYKRDVDNMVANLVSLIEPALIVFLGGGIGLLVASILMPLYSLTSAF